MNYDELPPQWPTIPLADPAHIANVLDLFVDQRARASGSLLILICDELHRPVQPLLIEALDDAPPADYLEVLGRMARTISQGNPRASVLCALARRDRLRVTTRDQTWRAVLEQSFAGEVEFLGVHLITTDGSIPIEDRHRAA